MEDERIYVYAKNGNFVKSYFEGAQKEIEQQEGQKVFISNIDLGKTAIIENGAARVMTRLDRIKASEEQLQEGEYIKGNEIITVERPNNFYFWDTNLNKWVYDQKLEKSSLEEEIGTLEGEISGLYDELDKAVARKLKMREKQLNEEIEKLNEKIENKYKRYNELEG